MMKNCIAILLLWLPLAAAGQSLDSLEQVLTKKLTKEEKIQVYQGLAWGHINDNPRRSRTFSAKGLHLARKAGDKKAEAAFLYYLGSSHYMSMAYDSAAYYFDQTLAATRENKDSYGEVSILKMYGQLHRKQGRYEEALKRYLEAAKVGEQLKDDGQLSIVYMGIGGTYHLMKNDKQALLYYEKAEKIALKHQDKNSLGEVYLSLSSVYKRQDDGKEKAIVYAQKSLKIGRELESKHDEINALQALSGAYFQFDDYTNAMKYAKEALALAQEIENAGLVAESYQIISSVLYYQKAYKKSAEMALEALKHDSTDYNMKLTIFSNLAVIYGRLGNFDSMEHYFDRYQTEVNNYSNETYQSSLSEMEVQYESEKKELKIGALEKQRQLYLWLGIAVAVILLVVLAFAFMRYRLAVSRRKLAEETMQRLEQEKQLVAVQATLDGEAAERTRLAKDLHDGLGSMLSAVKINLPQVKGNAVLEAVDVSRFQKAIGMLDDSIQELRRVAHHMMPESLVRYGLKVSLSDFCAAIPIADFHYFGNEASLPDKLGIMVYRCVHELVNNALKHAKATQINVQLIQEDDRLSFTVQDNGKGFDQQTVTEGMGLRNIRQRVAAFQGKIEMYSSGEGTEIHVELELKKNGQHD